MPKATPWLIALAASALTAACGDNRTDPQPIGPGDGGPPVHVNPGGAPASAACASDSDCYGDTCLGVPGGVEADNPRFTGGYCTTLGCQIDSQDGCGPDEWCVDGGGLGGFCVALCSKADGTSCARQGQVCLGLGSWGGCFSENAVECSVLSRTGCPASEICVRIGFDDPDLGRCEALCDPMMSDCAKPAACYYIRRYNAAICEQPGTTAPDQICSCDKCCTAGYACTPGTGSPKRYCKPYCTVGKACAGGTCVGIEPGSPWGGCFLPGSPGT